MVLTLDNGEKIEATLNHPFYVSNTGWVNAEKLVPGITLVLQDSSTKIISISRKMKIASKEGGRSLLLHYAKVKT